MRKLQLMKLPHFIFMANANLELNLIGAEGIKKW